MKENKILKKEEESTLIFEGKPDLKTEQINVEMAENAKINPDEAIKVKISEIKEEVFKKWT